MVLITLLYYEFDPPDVWPEFFLLGPLRIGTWQEARLWQIAFDPLSATQQEFQWMTADESSEIGADNAAYLTASSGEQLHLRIKLLADGGTWKNREFDLYWDTNDDCANDGGVTAVGSGAVTYWDDLGNDDDVTQISATAFDSASTYLEYYIESNPTRTQVQYSTTETAEWDFTVTVSTPGDYYLCVYHNDGSGGPMDAITNVPLLRVLDTVKPRINASIYNISSGQSAPKRGDVVNVTANVSDNVALDTCLFYMNDTVDGSFIVIK